LPSTAIDFHRLLVHFPVALLLFAAFFQLLAVWRRSTALQTVAKANLLAGAVMGVAAALFGLLAEDEFRNRFLEAHEALAFATVGWSVVVAATWLWKPTAEPRSRGGILVLVAVGIAGALVGATGYLGGHMAHGHGVHGPFAEGAAPPSGVAAAPTALPPELLPAYDRFAQKCSTCHGLDRPLERQVADGAWPAIVARMAEHAGGAITPEDQALIVRFLEYHATNPAVRLPAP
jgi:uncharacterized membrane protein